MPQFPPDGAGSGAGSDGGPSGPRADFGTRFVALLVDVVIIGVGVIILARILGRFGQVASLVAGLAYFTYFEGSPSGQTLGKRVMNIRVVDIETGGPLGHFRALLRAVMLSVSILVCFIGCLWMLWDRERQTWHDKVAGSVVVPTSDFPVEAWPG